MFSRSLSLAAFATLLSLVKSDPNSICYAYGVDFVDEGSYFINSQLTEKFSAVTYFQGCNQDFADVLLVEPEGVNAQEYICDDVSTYPENDFKLSTCPIQKNQMISGHWLLLVLGNNDDGNPFAWQRDLYLTVGTPVTSTVTPTVTFSLITTPIETQTTTTTSVNIVTTGPFSTVTLPSGTAKTTKTSTLPPTTITSTKVMTKTTNSYTKTYAVTTQTVTATCTTPGRPGRPDKPCRYSPTKLHPAALETPTSIPKMHRFMRKSDRAVDYEWARARVEAAKQKRAEQKAAAPLERRAPDAPTLTVTGDVPVNTTTTILAPASTTLETALTTETSISTLPPATVYSGLYTQTVTLPASTKTQLKLSYATTTKVITFGATYTKRTTVTPTTSVSACKKAGGHFW